MAIEPPKDPQFHWQWWHTLFAFFGLSPFAAFKRVRHFLFGWIKRKTEETINGEYVTRTDFENRMKTLHDDMKGRVSDSENRILDALKENVGYLREDIKTERESTEKRVQFLEKVFLDSRLNNQ